MKQVVDRPKAPAAGALEAKKGAEEAGWVETGRGRVEQVENDSNDKSEEHCGGATSGGCHADVGAHCLSEASLRAQES